MRLVLKHHKVDLNDETSYFAIAIQWLISLHFQFVPKEHVNRHLVKVR